MAHLYLSFSTYDSLIMMLLVLLLLIDVVYIVHTCSAFMFLKYLRERDRQEIRDDPRRMPGRYEDTQHDTCNNRAY